MAYLSSFSLFIYSLSRSLLQIMLMNVPGQPGSAKSSPMQQQQLRGGAYGNDTILLKKNNINIHLIKPIYRVRQYNFLFYNAWQSGYRSSSGVCVFSI